MLKPRKPKTLARELVWPEFTWIDDCLLLRSQATRNRRRLKVTHDRTDLECWVNHVHILDYFEHSAGLDDEPWYDRNSPDFASACDIGKSVARLWLEKLRSEFPDTPVRVLYSANDNPNIRFHVYRDSEGLYLDPQSWTREIAAGEMLFLSTDGGSTD